MAGTIRLAFGEAHASHIVRTSEVPSSTLHIRVLVWDWIPAASFVLLFGTSMSVWAMFGSRRTGLSAPASLTFSQHHRTADAALHRSTAGSMEMQPNKKRVGTISAISGQLLGSTVAESTDSANPSSVSASQEFRLLRSAPHSNRSACIVNIERTRAASAVRLCPDNLIERRCMRRQKAEALPTSSACALIAFSHRFVKERASSAEKARALQMRIQPIACT